MMIRYIRELLELRAERAHLHKISAEEECDGEGQEHGVATQAAKVNKCFGVKLATTYAYIATSALKSNPSLEGSFSGAVELRAERTHLHKIIGCAKVEEECDSEGEEYGQW